MTRHTRVIAIALLITITGCRTMQSSVVALPSRHAVQGEQVLVRSDVRLKKDHPLIADLASLRKQIAETLELPVQEQPVTIYLFADELRYAQYMKSMYPQLPPRRAYFIGTSKELAVYTFWGERIQEDLRHEYTHGVLHATLKDVPLWLDEGLAEYFEVAQSEQGLNREYSIRLTSGVENGWRPDLARLEKMTSVAQMQKADYQESWAWVHFMLHDGPEARSVLLDYLQELRTNDQPGSLESRLAEHVPQADVRLMQHASTLPKGTLATADDRPPH